MSEPIEPMPGMTLECEVSEEQAEELRRAGAKIRAVVHEPKGEA